MHDQRFAVQLDLRDGFAFGIDFDDGRFPELIADEPPPLGAGSGPNAARLLGAAIGHCLSASLLYCLGRAKVEVTGLRTTVEGSIARNDAGRLRIDGVRVRLEPAVASGHADRLARCIDLFEDYCTVTASVRQGIDVDVSVDVPAVSAAGP